jgi:hypothetical protein
MDPTDLAALVDKEAIRDLAMLYSRAVDRQDYDLVQSLYTEDATDTHGDLHFATVEAFVANLRKGMPNFRYTGHHICNHLIALDGETGEGEVYALAYHLRTPVEGEHIEWLMGVRYLDKYRKENGRWRFADRTVVYDWQTKRPIPRSTEPPPPPQADASYGVLQSALFRRGARANEVG